MKQVRLPSICGLILCVPHTALAVAVTYPILLLSSAHAATPRTIVAKVERVSDGDTLIAVSENQTKLRLRLLGIYAPENPPGQKSGQPTARRQRTA